jgi:hypothetical protein
MQMNLVQRLVRHLEQGDDDFEHNQANDVPIQLVQLLVVPNVGQGLRRVGNQPHPAVLGQ